MNFYSKIIILTTFILCFSSCIGVFEENPNSEFIPPELHIDDVVIDKGTRILTLRCYYLHSGSNSAPTEMGFYYSENADLSSDQREVSVIKNNYCEAHIIPVRYGKPFYYCAYASNGKNEIRSSVNFIDIPDFEYYVTLGKPNVVPTSGTDVTITSEINKADGVTLSESGVVVTDSDGHDTWVKSNEIGIINVQIKGLTTGAKYYVRSYVKDRDYIAFSEYAQFVPHTVPSLTTANMSDISYTKAISGGITISDNGLEITSKGVVYSTKPNPTIYNSLKTNNGAGTEDYVANISGLSPGTKYYLRAYAVNSDGVGYGNEITFETLSQSKATVTTLALSEVTSSSAMSGGNVTSDGGTEVTNRGVVWSREHNPTISLYTKTSDGSGTGKFTSAVTGLEPGTTYYLRAYASNALGTSYGEEVSFTTNAAKPSVTTYEATDITTTSAKIGGNVIATGGAEVTERGIVWSTSKNPTISNNKKQVGSGSGSFSTDLTDLAIATTYYVRAYAINSVGTSYGEEISFTTGSAKPTVTTASPSEVTSSSAISGGNVTSDGGSAVTERGVVWSTDHNPTVSLSTKTSDSTGTGSYVSSITNLEPGTTYYVRAYATNGNGTSYGEEVSFMTEITLPTVQTESISSISSNTACSGGKVISNGGASISACGIVWSTSPNPTVESSKTNESTSSNSFSSTMNNLKPSTKYYVRAYATNSKGTAYGNEISFTTKAEGSNEGVGNEDFEW